MASVAKDLHFVLFPLMAQGHMIPMVDIARIPAERGATATIITTPINADRFKPAIARAAKAKLDIRLVELQFPATEVGLPEGCENFDLLPSFEDSVKLFQAMDMLQKPSEELLRELKPAPSCIIADSLFWWTTEVAQKIHVPRLVFHGPGYFSNLCFHIIYKSKILEQIESGSDRFVIPNLPDHIEMTKAQVSSFGTDTSSAVMEYYQKLEEAEKNSYGFLVNSFKELEQAYAEGFANAKQKKEWSIGPVSLCNKNTQDITDRGNKAAISEHDCLNWLDQREPGSVIYVCLGSLTRLSNAQAIELGLGLELSNRPFVWCIKDTKAGLEKWLLEEKFEERVTGRGLIVHGWAPQVLILSHRAIGGFLTHCGWNSTLEGICAGLPMITWPQFADQFVNETFVVEILKIGIKIGVEVPVIYGEEEKMGVMVTKDKIRTTVESLMAEGEEAKMRREKARELADLAKKAMEEGGSSHLNITLLIEEILEQSVANTKS